MKLQSLIEREFDIFNDGYDVFENGQFIKYTHDDLVHAVQNRLAIDLSTDDDWFICIISDIPSIAQQKFHQLVELSFHKNLTCNKGSGDCYYENFFRIALLDEDDITGPEFTQQRPDVDIMAFNWKEFVEWVVSYYKDLVSGHDDFDE